MKTRYLFFLIAYIITSCMEPNGHNRQADQIPQDTADLTNDFFDNEPLHDLSLGTIYVKGEVKNPGEVDFSSLPLRSVIVKETLLSEDSNRFIGAYRYDGYSLYDMLNPFIPDKTNKEEFPPIIDLFVEISNGAGEVVRFSWGEIYYPVHQHQILIATRVMEVVPSKTPDHWPLPESARVVAAHDLITERNISSPVTITVKSIPMSFPVERDNKYSPEVSVVRDDSVVYRVSSPPVDFTTVTYPAIFYGRGRGIHSVTPFTGVLLREILSGIYPQDQPSIRQGLVVVRGIDGYRAAFTLSEIINRNDQSEVLLVEVGEGVDGGRFRLFTSADYFSDRAVFALEGIYFLK